MTLLATLIARDLRSDPADPAWPDRDRLLLPATEPASPGLAFGAAVGQAIAERLLAARFGRSLVDHRIWLVAHPAELSCGTGREAAHIAGALGLGRLTVLTTLAHDDKSLRASYAAAGWTVRAIPPGDAHAGEAALSACQRAQKPTLILSIGEAAPAPGPPPPNARGAAARRAWLKRLRRHASRDAFQHALSGHLPPGWQKACQPETPQAGQGNAATLIAALARLAPILPDLANLPLSEVPLLPPPQITPFPAGVLSWEALDLAAPACLVGMSQHGGILPISQAPASAELPRAAWRLAAAQRVRWLHTIAHAGSAPPLPELGIANLHVFQPADPAEALECLALALRRPDGPSVMTLPADTETAIACAAPRQCARGAYLVHAPPSRDLTLLTAGAGLAAAGAVRALLAERGVAAALVSMPCRALWDAQDAPYRRSVLGMAPIVAFAGDALAFAGLIGPGDLIIGADTWPPEPLAALGVILRHREG